MFLRFKVGCETKPLNAWNIQIYLTVDISKLGRGWPGSHCAQGRTGAALGNDAIVETASFYFIHRQKPQTTQIAVGSAFIQFPGLQPQLTPPPARATQIVVEL